MNHKAKLMPTLIISAMCMHCATPQQGAGLDRAPFITAHCAYVNTRRSLNKAEVECTLANSGDRPARIHFKKAILDEPSAEIQPIDFKKLKKLEFSEDVVVILGVVLVIGVLFALASRSKINYVPQVHFHIPQTASRPSAPAAIISSSTEKSSIKDTISISGQGSATLLFAVRYGQKKPDALILEFDDGEERSLRVPIEVSSGHKKGRSNFDY